MLEAMTENEGPEPASRAPAPGALGLVQAFVNTNDLEGADELGDRQTVRDWLVERELLPLGAEVSEVDFRLAIQVREAIRALALANHAGGTDEQAVETLNRLTEGSRLAVRFEGGGRARLEPLLPGVDGAMGRMLAIVYASMVEGTWPRLKACRSHSCRWLFYDRSRNRSSTWCAMAVCGNREKARTYRDRKRR